MLSFSYIVYPLPIIVRGICLFDNFEKLSMLLGLSRDILEEWVKGCCVHVFLVTLYWDKQLKKKLLVLTCTSFLLFILCLPTAYYVIQLPFNTSCSTVEEFLKIISGFTSYKYIPVASNSSQIWETCLIIMDYGSPIIWNNVACFILTVNKTIWDVSCMVS